MGAGSEEGYMRGGGQVCVCVGGRHGRHARAMCLGGFSYVGGRSWSYGRRYAGSTLSEDRAVSLAKGRSQGAGHGSRTKTSSIEHRQPVQQTG